MTKPEQKSASKEKKADIATQRRKQQEEIIVAIEGLREHLNGLKADTRRLAFQKSVATGLYDEMDKLTKKAPAEQVTDLALRHVNHLIRETKDLLKHDAEPVNDFETLTVGI